MSENRGPRFPQIVSYDQVPKNLLTNPGFDVWQRGSGPFTSGSYSFTADEWWKNPAECTVTQETTDVLFGTSSLKLDFISSLGAFAYVRQGVENWKTFEGRWLTFSCWAKFTGANNIVAIGFNYRTSSGTNNVYSNYHTGGGDWEQLTVTLEVPTGLDITGEPNWAHDFPLGVGCWITNNAASNETAYFDGATLVEGKFPEGVPYVPHDPAIDFNFCERFYQRGVGFGNGLFFVGGITSGATYYSGTQYPTDMAETPTVTLIHNGHSGFSTSVGTTITRKNGCGSYRTATSTGRGYYASNWIAEVT